METETKITVPREEVTVTEENKPSKNPLKKIPALVKNINPKKMNKKQLIITGVIALAIIAGGAVLIKKLGGKNTEMMNNTLVAVERRDIQNTVSGSSVIQPKDSYSLTAMVEGEILSDTFNEGDIVKKGDVLYRIDDETAQKSLTSAQNGLEKAQRNYENAVKEKAISDKTTPATIQSAQNSVTKAQQSYNEALEAYNNLSVKSTASGTVSEVFVEKGDSVNSGAKIAAVYSDTYMKIRLPFNENDMGSIRVGSGATVTVAGDGSEIWGSVSEISSGGVTTSSNAIVRYVTIEVKNPGALGKGDMGTAVINGVACNDAGSFEYINETSITAETSGKVISLNIDENDKIYKGQTIAKLESDDALTKLNNAKMELTEAQNSLTKTKLENDGTSAENSLKNAKAELEDAKINLEKAQKTLDDYTITAPIDGTIVTKNKKAGDNIKNGNSSSDTNVMAEIYDLSSLKFQMDVDETEVGEIEVGQSVTITADAVEGEFYGTVEKVGIDGTSSNGVTTYPIDVVITDYGELLPGMNITAEIVVGESLDTLAIPVSAVHRGNIVYVKDDGAKSDEEKAPENKSGEEPNGVPPAPRGERPAGAPQMGEGEQPEGMPPRGERAQGERPEGAPDMSGGGRTNSKSDAGSEAEQSEGKAESGSANKENSNERSDKLPGAANVPEGYKAVRVEIGINDSEYIEILSGLEEGQEVLVQTVASSGENGEEQMPMMGGPMGGGMPGGMGGPPMGGGMPGGGGNMGGNRGGMR